MTTEAEEPIGMLIARGRRRQRELYGVPLGDRVRHLMAALDVSQARLARTLGISPAMLSQLVSARRTKIGDPAVLARLLLLDQRCRAVGNPPEPRAVDALLAEVAQAQWQWNGERGPGTVGAGPPSPGQPVAPVRQDVRPRRHGLRDGSAAAALRGVTEPARLAAAAAVLGSTFPEVAEVLRQAASRD